MFPTFQLHVLPMLISSTIFELLFILISITHASSFTQIVIFVPDRRRSQARLSLPLQWFYQWKVLHSQLTIDLPSKITSGSSGKLHLKTKFSEYFYMFSKISLNLYLTIQSFNFHLQQIETYPNRDNLDSVNF